jgi:hypothetical protein
MMSSLKAMKRALLLLSSVAYLFTVGCSDDGESAGPATPSSYSQGSQQTLLQKFQDSDDLRSAKSAIIPGDVTYLVINTDALPRIKRSLDVRLNKKVSSSVLGAIALVLKSRDSGEYERTFMAYYLPGMEVGSGAWATTHFTPNLKVQILGLSKENEERLLAETEPSNREIIGQWLDESPFVGGKVTIFRESGKLFSERKFPDGGVLKKELVERDSTLGQRFDFLEGSNFGDCWIISPSGTLLICDDQGLISTAEKIR